jgi:protein-S-isoprenylcysteine O-methyltransferase Ste14
VKLITQRFPLFIMVIGVMALVLATVRELLRGPSPVHLLAAALYGLHLLWTVVETRTTVDSSQQENRETDRGTLQFYGMARIITVVACCFGPAEWRDFQPWMLLVAFLFVAGVAFRLIAIRTLGRFYSHRVRTLSDHQIVQTGPYRWIRHPAYTGMAVANIAFVLFFLNPVSVAALVVLLLPSLMIRILVEERVLFALDGYREYAVGRRRLVPFVW